MAGIMDIISGLVGGVGDAVSKVTNAVGVLPADKQAELTTTLAKLQADATKAQTDIEQASLGVTGTNFFKFWVAGPRPFILWICGVAFGLQYVIVPVAHWFGWMIPVIDMGVPTEVVLGLLGLGNIVTRSIEKINGAAGSH
jgi:hypothetical protein